MTSIPHGQATPPHNGVHRGVVRADPADVDTLSRVIADAFHDLPPSRWLVPDQAARREIFPGYFRLYVEHALASGVVHTTTDRTAAALWLPIGENATDLPADYGTSLAAATGPWIDRFLAFDETLDRHHPVGIPHHHLAILAVRPDRQGQGTGAMLLRAYHQILDHDVGAAAYLEAADLRTRQLYLRHGYVLRPNAPFCLPVDGPPMWPMWREPQRRPGTA
jgi:GNAT superfamily N-acetyltransferase